MKKAAPRDCPCFSGKRYNACCGPIHRGERSAETCEDLMRSRYAAFAMGLGAYLVATLASGHADRAHPPGALAAALSRAKDTQRFLGLRILFTGENGDEGEVMFYARIFEKGLDASFAELSRFVREGGSWRYADGAQVATADLPTDPTTLRVDELRSRLV